MAISLVDVGAVAAATATTLTVASPAGSIGDLLLFVFICDDFSDGNLTPDTPPIALTEIIPNQSTQFSGDFRANCYWGVEDQAAARDFDFGPRSLTEQLRGVCLRFSGQAATPILSGTPTRRSQLCFPGLTATRAGQWFISMLFTNYAFATYSFDPPAGWTERVDSGGTYNSFFVATKPVTTEGLALADNSPTSNISSGTGWGFGFVLDVDGPTAYTISGVTKDKDGTALGSCTVVLLKDAGTNDWKQITTQTSNATTGVYSFTVYDNHAKYMVIAYKGDTPHVFDVTDYVLQPA